VLLRCTSQEMAESLPIAPRLLVAILSHTPLRKHLKAELGAFFPLLLLKPLEVDRLPAAVLTATLDASRALASDAQLMVDLFVNYDCDLQAVNVFERWLQGLRRAAVTADASVIGVSVQTGSLNCMATLLEQLNGWVQQQQQQRRTTHEHAQSRHTGIVEEDAFEVRLRLHGPVFFESKAAGMHVWHNRVCST
jgi:Guanine nucleotide exchange factor in Golgi transport N-terminal